MFKEDRNIVSIACGHNFCKFCLNILKPTKCPYPYDTCNNLLKTVHKTCKTCKHLNCGCYGENKFSRYFNKNGYPYRLNEITQEMHLDFLEKIKNDHMTCPTCSVTFQKISACNEIRHCGNVSICNLCRYTSFPWENGIDLNHWKTCKRWDSEIYGYQCNSDCTENCVKHPNVIKNARKKFSLSCLKNELAI